MLIYIHCAHVLNIKIIDTNNKLERDFRISKHHFISQIMGYTIVSGNTPSSVALYQIHAIVFIEMFYSKSQIAKNQLGWC